MKKNIIFVFSGTGNSLWTAKKISEELENCEILSMGWYKEYILTEEYDVIGFVDLTALKIKPFQQLMYNYEDKTKNRKRYTHPDIPWKELAKLNE